MRTEAWDIFKKNLGIVVIGLVALFIYLGGCGNRDGQGRNTSDTTHYTVQQPQPIIIMPPYQPTQTGTTVYPITIPSQNAPSQDITKLTEQYIKLYNEFAAIRNYRDSITLKDTAGNRVGVVNLEQSVSENILKSTKPSYQLNFPHTFTTITNTIYPKPRNQVFIGGGAQASANKPSIEQLQLGVLLKNKHDLVVGLSGTYNLQTKSPGIQATLYKKISFKPLKLIGL